MQQLLVRATKSAWPRRRNARLELMDFQEKLNEVNDLINEWLEITKEYFGQLNDMEKYGWAAEGTGFLIFLVGFILLII